MTKDEYWVLNLVVECKVSMKILESENLEISINGKGHGLRHVELVDVLHQLFQNASLIAFKQSGEAFFPTESEIDDILCGKRDIYFGLTPKGGQRWETVSVPEWSRFISASATFVPNELEIICNTKILAKEYVGIKPFQVEPILETVKWDTVTPWHATYWKTLLRGYRFGCQHRDCDDILENSSHEQLRRLNTWYVHPFTS